jgi:hypothetical protein
VFLKLIACEISFREICWCAAHSPNLFDFSFLSQGYHDNTDIGLEKIQAQVDAVPAGRYDAILLGYGLCNNIITGLVARDTPIVIPRAHDCITFFLGSKERYRSFFIDHPGTYYYTTGWLEHRQRGGERVERRQGAGLGVDLEYQALAEKYGEDNARFLMETMDNWTAHYTHGVFIDFEFSRNLPAKQQAKDICRERGWAYQEAEGDLSLLQAWMDGPWPEADFLTVRSGERVAPTYDETIIQIQPAEADPAAG